MAQMHDMADLSGTRDAASPVLHVQTATLF